MVSGVFPLFAFEWYEYAVLAMYAAPNVQAKES